MTEPKEWPVGRRYIDFRISEGAFYGVLMGLTAATLIGVATCKPAENAVIAGVDAACVVLDKQPEPEWVYYTCVLLDAAGNVITTETVKVPKGSSQAFATKHVKALPDAGP